MQALFYRESIIQKKKYFYAVKAHTTSLKNPCHPLGRTDLKMCNFMNFSDLQGTAASQTRGVELPLKYLLDTSFFRGYMVQVPLRCFKCKSYRGVGLSAWLHPPNKFCEAGLKMLLWYISWWRYVRHFIKISGFHVNFWKKKLIMCFL